MSSIAALATPSQNTKPGSVIYVETMACKNMTVSGTQAIQNLEVKNNLLVDGYINSSSDQETVGTNVFNSQFPNSISVGASNGGQLFSFSPTLGKLVNSGLAGANTATASTNGSTFSQLTTPFSNPMISWMPSVGLFAALDNSGTAVYTSPTAVNGTWVIGTPLASACDSSSSMFYSSIYQKLYMGNVLAGSKIYSTSNGSVWTPCASSRSPYFLVQAPASSGLGSGTGRMVGVGQDGPSYSDDGINFSPGNVNTPMSCVTWSPYWSMFVATPRNGVLTNIYISVDGINWTTVSNAFDSSVSNLRFVVWIPQYQVFVAGGDSSQFYISKDGRRWRKLFGTIAGLASYGAAYIKEWGQFYAGGIGGNVAATSRRYAL